MAKGPKCCGTGELRALTCCSCGIGLEVIKPLVNAPELICRACGRVVNEKKSLCKPVLLL